MGQAPTRTVALVGLDGTGKTVLAETWSQNTQVRFIPHPPTLSPPTSPTPPPTSPPRTLSPFLTFHPTARRRAQAKFVPPTSGPELRTCTRDGVRWRVYDLPGRAELRSLWPAYLRAADGAVFVVDAADVHRLGEVRSAYLDLIAHPVVRDRGIPVMLVLNAGKPTPPDGALTPDLLLRLLGTSHAPLFVTVNALRSEGLDELSRRLRDALGLSTAA
jgi:GTPase SAR1 family protein